MLSLDLFSGVGGFAIGLHRAGIQTIAFCEWDEACRKVLTKRFPDVPIASDIRKLSYHDGALYYDGAIIYRGTIELVCGGFPCQPFSTAGKRRGTEDDRHLWPEMLRIIKEVGPRFVLAENVAGLTSVAQPIGDVELVSLNQIRLAVTDHHEAVHTQQEALYIANIIEDIESAGLEVPRLMDGTPCILRVPACAVGAPHRRDRVFFLGYATESGGQHR